MQLISTSVIKGTEDFEGQKKKRKKVILEMSKYFNSF